ncbi:peroxiredoxin family protein [Paenibacillus cremeus]|nr:TlpA disulfide reductase family protein [Paenibacillus cremeus]
MDTMTWGPLVLQKHMLFAIVAAAAGYGILRLRLRGSESAAAVSAVLLNALLIWIVSWKLSLLLFNGMSVLRNPVSLLYFNGGERGVWLATLLAAGYVGFMGWKNKKNLPIYTDSGLGSILGGASLYLAFIFFEGEQNRITLGLIVLLGVVLTVLWLRSRPTTHWRMSVQWAVMFILGYALIQSLAAHGWDKPGTTAVAEDVGLKVGQQAPDFDLMLLSGQPAKLSDYRGRTVILNFWATWCPPCKAEMPEMQSFFAENEKNGVVVLGVNATSTEASVPVVKAWVDEWGLSFPVALDSKGDVSQSYRVNAYPATYVIDGDGVIRDKHPGPMNADMLKEAATKAKPGK